jgi:hypothetical protein
MPIKYRSPFSSEVYINLIIAAMANASMSAIIAIKYDDYDPPVSFSTYRLTGASPLPIFPIKYFRFMLSAALECSYLWNA